MMMMTLFLSLVGIRAALGSENFGPLKTGDHHKYVVIGAGPAGLQMAQHLSAVGEDFVILEQKDHVGSFFSTYPRHDFLLSINKVFTGSRHREFNLRHDWNSILSVETERSTEERANKKFRTNMRGNLSVTNFTHEYYPDRRDVVRYLNAYAEHFGIRVHFNTRVTKIGREIVQNGTGTKELFELDYVDEVTKETGRITGDVVFVATGLPKPHIPANIKGIDSVVGYEDMSVNISDYVDKKVAIIGGKNSAFETAQFISRRSAVTHMFMNNLPHFAFESHYVGDLRSINMEFIDHYMLKSLDAFSEQDDESGMESSWKITHNTEENTFRMQPSDYRETLGFSRAYPFRDPYDIVIRCTGFEFDYSIFSGNLMAGDGLMMHQKTKENCTMMDDAQGMANKGRMRNNKYPHMSTKYQIGNSQNLYILGTAMHGVDFKKAAGAFIHGFRYLVRAVFNGVVAKYSQNVIEIDLEDIGAKILSRINTASSFYQMFGFMSDIIVIGDDGQTRYFYDMLISQVNDIESTLPSTCAHVLVLTFNYHKEFHGFDKVWTRERVHNDYRTSEFSNFLHPIILNLDCGVLRDSRLDDDLVHLYEYVVSSRHLMEDFLTKWDHEATHQDWLYKWLEAVVHVKQKVFDFDTLEEVYW